MENQNPRVPPLWEHSLTPLLGHDPTSDPGIALGNGNRNTSKSKARTPQGCLLMLWMDENASQQSNKNH